MLYYVLKSFYFLSRTTNPTLRPKVTKEYLTFPKKFFVKLWLYKNTPLVKLYLYGCTPLQNTPIHTLWGIKHPLFMKEETTSNSNPSCLLGGWGQSPFNVTPN